MVGLVWDKDEENAPSISDLPRGEVSTVPQPAYILVEVNKKLIPVRVRNDTLRLRGKKRKIHYLNSPVDLLFAVTFHKLQGLTLNEIILSIGNHPTYKLRVTMSSLYVGTSRVHGFKELRILPCKDKDLAYLTKLKRDPLLLDWYKNYSVDGSWKRDGFVKAQKEHLSKIKQNLALVDNIETITKEEAKKFLKQLDLQFDERGGACSLRQSLRTSWEEGRQILEADNNKLLNAFRLHELKELAHYMQKNYIRVKKLRSIARKVGIKNTGNMSRVTLLLNLDKAARRYMESSDINFRIFSGIAQKKKKQFTEKLVQFEPKIHEQLQKKTSNKISSGKDSIKPAITASSIEDVTGGDDNDMNSQKTEKPATKKKALNQPAIIIPTPTDLAAEEDEIKSHYYTETNVHVPGFGFKKTIYNSGGGDCFFIAIQQGLRLLNMVPFNHVEIRRNLSLWFQDDKNAAAIAKLLGATPYDLIPWLPVVGGMVPQEGWSEYLRGRNWNFWGQRIAISGTWVGAIELEAMNELLLNGGYDVRVNIYDSASRRLFGGYRNVSGQLVIILRLEWGHFELLKPINRAV